MILIVHNVINLLKKQASDYGAQLIVITHDSRLKEHFKNSIEAVNIFKLSIKKYFE